MGEIDLASLCSNASFLSSGLSFASPRWPVFESPRSSNPVHVCCALSIPRQSTIDTVDKNVTKLLYAAYEGDTTELQRLLAQGFEVNGADYDARTALHLASAEGHQV